MDYYDIAYTHLRNLLNDVIIRPVVKIEEGKLHENEGRKTPEPVKWQSVTRIIITCMSLYLRTIFMPFFRKN